MQAGAVCVPGGFLFASGPGEAVNNTAATTTTTTTTTNHSADSQASVRIIPRHCPGRDSFQRLTSCKHYHADTTPSTRQAPRRHHYHAASRANA
ncbi:hypothetical protein E2C01_016270 [Portunus trituberculatus]|uniref:Uncharacterized protein n=1 Tax=Portunus trituberculatus TaxID=210409 RepID=A0A5B7DNN3_PORTR|nr:hypothetical protein [Portunus trituberculatus]